MNNLRTLIFNLLTGYLAAAASAVAIVSCSDGAEKENPPCEIHFRMDISHPSVKSSIEPEPDRIEDMNIFAFSDGEAVCHIYTDDMSKAKLLLGKGEYDLFFAANFGRMADFKTEEELSGWRFRIGSSSSLSGSLQQYTSKKHVEIHDGTPLEIQVTLIRTAAKCGFKFDASAIPGLEIKSVRLCQTALDITPFAKNGSSPEKVERYGDFASAADIVELNRGGTVFFYALENIQGNLLPDNNDPWAKVPDSIPEKAGVCSYLEVTGSFGENATEGLYGNVKYRFFLGHDATSDFSLTRNTECVVEMTASREGLGKISWLIDTSEMKTDPLYGFGKFTPPEYAGQWGRISIPGASEETPVRISCGGESMTVGRDNDVPQKYIISDNGYIIYLVPAVSQSDVFIYASPARMSTRKSDECTLRLESEASVREITLQVPKFAEYHIRETGKASDLHEASLNEDGFDGKNIDIVLTGKDGSALDAEAFRIPEKRLAGALGYTSATSPDGDVYGSFLSDFTLGTEISSGPAGFAKEDTSAGQQTENFCKVMSGILYGSSEGNCNVTISNRYHAAAETSVACSVHAAFPGQRYLGEMTNGQLNISGRAAEDHIEKHILDMYQGKAGSSHASWSCVRVSPYTGTTPSAAVFSRAESGYSSMAVDGMADGKLTVRMLPPSRDYSSGDTPFFTCGAFCFRGIVTNPHTGRRIEGYWIQDIVLEFTVTAQVDFMPGYVCFSYVPYNICFASPKYSKTWQDNLPLLVRPDNLVPDSQIGDEAQNITFISGNRPLGLVPFNEWQKPSRLASEYRVMTLVPSGYDDSNRYPFCEAKENELTGLLWEELSSGEGNTGIDIAKRTVSSFIPLRENGTYMPAVKSLTITRNNFQSYPAFKGFYKISRDYGTYVPSLIGNIGRYVIEASPKALEYQTPFYSDML